MMEAAAISTVRALWLADHMVRQESNSDPIILWTNNPKRVPPGSCPATEKTAELLLNCQRVKLHKHINAPGLWATSWPAWKARCQLKRRCSCQPGRTGRGRQGWQSNVPLQRLFFPPPWGEGRAVWRKGLSWQIIRGCRAQNPAMTKEEGREIKQC